MLTNQKVKKDVTEKDNVPEFIEKNTISLTEKFTFSLKTFFSVENCPPSLHM